MGREDKLWALPPKEGDILKMFLTSILKRHIIKAY
jgi:hypothetical protein